ncbi:MAG: hypothetical protein JSU72_20910, partial [Deltaproteobacteria bacterium]
MVAPEKFKRAMLDARRDVIRARRLEAFLKVLASYPVEHLIRQAIQAGFVTGLEDLESSDLTLLSTLSPLEETPLPFTFDSHKIPVRSGKNGQ